jgi:phosphoribosylformylglycinamidine synthase
VHDVSDGGLLVAIAEMAMASGIGALLEQPITETPGHAIWFGEDQARYLVTVRKRDVGTVLERFAKAGVSARQIGVTDANTVSVVNERPLSVAALKARFERWLPDYMASTT